MQLPPPAFHSRNANANERADWEISFFVQLARLFGGGGDGRKPPNPVAERRILFFFLPECGLKRGRKFIVRHHRLALLPAYVRTTPPQRSIG